MKKIFALMMLLMCALGTAFADISISEAEFYKKFTQLARNYMYVYVIEVDGDSDEYEFYYEEDEDAGISCIFFEGNYDTIGAFFSNNAEEAEAYIKDELEDEYYHWRRISLSSGYTKALNYFKALIEVCK